MAQSGTASKVIRVMNAVAAGTSVQHSTAVDMAGYQGVRFIAGLGVGSASSVGQLKAEDCDTSGGSYNDIAGSAGTAYTPTTDDNKCSVLDIYRPRHRYVKAVIVRGTGNSVIDFVIAELYGPHNLPVTNDATTVLSTKLLVSPADGTA
jgi:hypothetical protein